MSHAPSLSLGLPNFAADDPGAWDHLLVRAEAADEAGIDRVVVSDHVVFGERLDEYGKPEVGGTAGGKQPTGPDGHWLEPLATLVGDRRPHARVRLATGILIAALRRPVVLAKTAATLDVLSGGRLDLGVGVGWQREEYEAAGLSFAGRGRLLDQTLAVCQTLWTRHRRDLPVGELRVRPHPPDAEASPGRWCADLGQRHAEPAGGGTCRAIRVGLDPVGPRHARPHRGIAQLREALDAAGRGDVDLQVTGALPVVRDADALDLARTMDGVPTLVAAGLTDLRADIRVPADKSAAIDVLAPLVAAFRQAVS